MKKLISTTLALTFIVIALIGCAPSDNGTASPVAEKNVTKYTTEGKTTKLVGDPTATGELLISCYSDATAVTGDGEVVPMDDRISFATKKFKELYPNVDVVVERGAQSMEFQEYTAKMGTEIMAGTGPDIFFVGETNKDVNKMIKSGSLANMYEFFENDKNFNINDYNAAVFCGGQPDKSQYIIPLSYTVPIYLSTEKMLKKAGIDVSKMDNYLLFLQEMDKALQKEEIKELIPIWNINSVALYFPNYSGIDRYNFEDGTVNLDAPELKSILQLQKTHREKYTYISNVSSYSQDTDVSKIKNEKKLFVEAMYYGISGSVDMFANLVKLEEKPILFSMRNMSGGISAVANYNSVAVNAGSKNKQNAYNFLKVLIDPELNANPMIFSSEIPIANAAFELYIDKYIEQKTEMTGTNYDAALESRDEFIKQYKAFLDDVNDVDWYAYADFTIRDEMKPFYKGEKSYDECIKNAQEKLEIYISE